MMWRCLLVLALVWYGQMSIVQGHFNQKLKDGLFEDLLNMMMKIKGPGHGHHGKRDVVAFSASMTKSQLLSVKEVVKFDRVWTNIGKGYDKNSGIFTARKAGVYQFTCTAMTPSGKNLYIHLWHDQLRTSGLHMTGSGYRTGTINMVLSLKKNDKVSIKSGHANQSIYSDSNIYSTFSGYLISQ